MIRAVAFDIDDTLFLERDYVRSGFRAVAGLLAARVDASVDWFAELWAGFEAGVRGDAFNRVLAAHGVEPDGEMIERLVRRYREHDPRIAPLDDVVPALDALELPPGRMGVISDGPVVMQRKKFDALGLGDRLEHVILTDAWGVAYRKPHPRAFEEFEARTGRPPAACAYVSDNPSKDFTAPHGRGWRTVRVRRPGGLHRDEPDRPGEVDATVTTLAELSAVLGLGR